MDMSRITEMMEQEVHVEFEQSERDTWIDILCNDRTGLLLDIIHALVQFNFSVRLINKAVVETSEQGKVRDRFAIRNADGMKVTDCYLLQRLKSKLVSVATEKPIAVNWKKAVGNFQVFQIICPERSHLLGDLVYLLETNGLAVKACEIVSEEATTIWLCFCSEEGHLVTNEKNIVQLMEEVLKVIKDPSKVRVAQDSEVERVVDSTHRNNLRSSPTFLSSGRVIIDNSLGPYTTIAVYVDDRFGLLYDLVLALTRYGFQIISANITTREDGDEPENVKAYDIFTCTGSQVCTTPEEVNLVRQTLLEAAVHPVLVDRRDANLVVELCFSKQMKCANGMTDSLRKLGLSVHRAVVRSERTSQVFDKLYIKNDSKQITEETYSQVADVLLSRLLELSRSADVRELLGSVKWSI
eukprot:jgi/Galph1/5541/GphlegSOOS_G4126.1